MRYRICFVAAIIGIAVISGIIESLATPRAKTEEGMQEAGKAAIPAPAE